MPTAQRYQHRAAECLRLARGTTNLTNKALLLEMAQTWIKLAEQAQAKQMCIREPLRNPGHDAGMRGGPCP